MGMVFAQSWLLNKSLTSVSAVSKYMQYSYKLVKWYKVLCHME